MHRVVLSKLSILDLATQSPVLSTLPTMGLSVLIAQSSGPPTSRSMVGKSLPLLFCIFLQPLDARGRLRSHAQVLDGNVRSVHLELGAAVVHVDGGRPPLSLAALFWSLWTPVYTSSPMVLRSAALLTLTPLGLVPLPFTLMVGTCLVP